MPDFESEQKPSRRLWILAAAGALALHLGFGALAIAHLQTREDQDSLGAPAIEIGLELASSRAEPINLPPGPEVDASTASPQLAEQQAAVNETELPKDTPAEADDPDRVVKPNGSKKKEDDPKIATVQTLASTLSLPQQATAAPRLDGRLDDKATAPKLGIGNSTELAKLKWDKTLVAHFRKHLIFPEGEKVKSAKVRVVLDLEFDRMGHVVSAGIAEGSGRKAFDEAALKMVRRSDPVPIPPPLVADEGLKRTVPVDFNHAKSK
jgi:periplasmic protein TonB